ncbi:MAG: hypothetical protein MUC94_17330 [bacterium]|nr:hypothetical protein [bacterium]
MAIFRKTVLFFLLVFSCSLMLFSQPNEIISIADRRELFVDYHLIDKLEGTELRLHEPRQEGIAIKFDKPWEGGFSAYVTVIKDGDLYRMYYRGLPRTQQEGEDIAVACYAESKDGIQWTKPNLGIFEVMGIQDNNVILANASPFTHNFCPFIDTKPGIPKSEKFKAIAGNENSGLVGFISEDGIHWKKLRDESIFREGMFDSQNVVFWSEHEQCYVCYFRTWTGEGYTGFRTISRTTSTDFLNWTDPVPMEFGKTPMEHLYTNATHPYFRAPHIYIAMPKRFFPDKAAFSAEIAKTLVDNPGYRIASSDAVLMTSRGANRYDRTFMEAFIRPGTTPQDWIARDNTPALGVVPGNDRELFIYRMSHYAQPTAHLTRYSLRLDGFVSVHAPYNGGELITKPFIFSGSELEINFATSAAGGIQVEIQNANGEAIPSVSLDDCPEFIGDAIDYVVHWKNGSDVSQLAGKPIRLRFLMKDADLYALQFK